VIEVNISEKMKPRHAIFEDHAFWEQLEYELTHWFSARGEKDLRRFWIDGFIPAEISDTAYGVEVKGDVWVGTSDREQSSYRFSASIPQSLLERKHRSYRLTAVEIDAEKRTLDLTIERD
jgi:hypothetical protein